MASSLPDATQQILAVVGKALQRVHASHRHDTQKRILKEEHARKVEDEEGRRLARIKNGTWHDGRLDCVAGNGVMSELGIGDELWGVDDVAGSMFLGLEKDSPHNEKQQAVSERNGEDTRKKKAQVDVEAVSALPIVIIRNFDSKTIGGMGLAARANSREDVLNTLANWAGSLVENQVAHVIVISDNRENSKRLARGEHRRNIHRPSY